MGAFLMVGGMIALVGGIAWMANVADKKRTAAMQVVAQTMGFTFFPEIPIADAIALGGDLPVFNHGHAKRAVRMMRGTLAGRNAAIFDYKYTTGSGKSQHVHLHTVVLFPEGGAGLPAFTLGPENFLHRFAGMFGYQDIDFPEFPDFSKHYLLRGADEPAIREAFNSTVLAFLGGTTGWQVQSNAAQLAVFREGSFAKPELMPSYAADALRIAGFFKTA
jgi:hypothetical protein